MLRHISPLFSESLQECAPTEALSGGNVCRQLWQKKSGLKNEDKKLKEFINELMKFE